MLRRITTVVALAALVFGMAACHSNYKNPLAAVDSKQPDKSLYDNAMKAMNSHHYDAARQLLSTLINTYPDSEYVARAKLTIGDAWYYEGGAAALAQAENEYRDFRTFFPNMAEAAEAQMKVADIHYQAMEKPDRDYTDAKRAEDEYREMLMQYPDSKLADKARLRLLEVQEVLAEREYRIGKFYQSHEVWNAAIARLKTLTDTYPLYSQSDQALFALGLCYEGQLARFRTLPLKPEILNLLARQSTDGAAEAYSRIVTRYPAMPAAQMARERLKALDRPVPTPTEDAIALNKKEIASRGRVAIGWHVWQHLSRKPNESIAVSVKVGMPTLADPKPTDASELNKKATEAIQALIKAEKSDGKGGATIVNGAGAPEANQPVPRSDSTQPDSNTPAPAPSQVNEVAAPDTGDKAASAAGDKSANSLAPASTSKSSSSKKKKHGLSRLNPF